MKIKYLILILVAFYAAGNTGCSYRNPVNQRTAYIRQLVDTVGFAQYSWQMDSIMSRIKRKGWAKTDDNPWKLAVCPHDDYTYVGTLYPEVLQNVKASCLILIGVAHKARQLGIEDSLVFDNFDFWKGPSNDVAVSPVREELLDILSGKYAIVSDTLHKAEHSIESMIPFLQYFNKEISIIPVLVPTMDQTRMEECGKALAEAIREVADKNKWEWGEDYAIIVTTDAVHYGNEDWGGSDYAFFGCDSAGNRKAFDHEAEIINNCLTGKITPDNIRLFSSYTLNPDNYKEYKWTWCGRYCVPTALYVSYYLNDSQPLTGKLIGYSSSITSEHIMVDDIGMGRTAVATDCHWVGYAALGCR